MKKREKKKKSFKAVSTTVLGVDLKAMFYREERIHQ